MRERKTRLAIGIDPPSSVENRLEYALNIVDQTHENAICYKPNMQFWIGSCREDLIELNEKIHGYGLLSIADIKLSDIGNTNKNAIENLAALGFDYLTHSPFPGNVKETSKYANQADIGLITLVVMSNPQAKWMVDTTLYREWTELANDYTDGIVLGTTNHVTSDILEDIANSYSDKFILAPGIGAQGGNVGNLKNIFGDRVLFNVSRGIGLSDDPAKQSKHYADLTVVN